MSSLKDNDGQDAIYNQSRDNNDINRFKDNFTGSGNSIKF
jgi:hypothetical protein